MKAYVINKIFSELEPSEPKGQWILSTLFRVPQEIINTLTGYKKSNLPIQVYRYFAHLQITGDKYIDKYQSAKADLIASMIDPPAEDPGEVEYALTPPGDPSYWLCSYVLGFTDEEMTVLCGIPEEHLQDPRRELVPILKIAMDCLKTVKLEDAVLTEYHRSRYLLLRYYLDAYYHELHA